MFKILTASLCLLTTSFLAASHPTPGQWNVVGEYLYLQPSVDDSYFVIESVADLPDDGNVRNILTGVERSNQFDFTSAFRVGLEYAFCDCGRDFGIYYTNLDTNHRKTISKNFLSPTLGVEDFTDSMFQYQGRASSRVSVDYQSLDALLGQQIGQCCGFDFRAVLGVEFTKLHYHQTINYLPLSSENVYSSIVNQRANTRGVGPKIGLEFDYALCQTCGCLPGSLNLNAFSTASLLVSRCKARTNLLYTRASTIYPYNVGLRKSTRVIPAFHMGIGLNYNICCSCYAVDVGVGYEFSAYLKSLLTQKNIAYYGKGLTDVSYSDFDTQGLYVSLSVQF